MGRRPHPARRQALAQEYSRVLSDGRIVGRAEAVAKVSPSSQLLKPAIGLAPWAVLEDIALDAALDEDGRLGAETNVRRTAENLHLNKGSLPAAFRPESAWGFAR